MEMVLASVNLWDTIDGFEKAPPSNVDPTRGAHLGKLVNMVR